MLDFLACKCAKCAYNAICARDKGDQGRPKSVKKSYFLPDSKAKLNKKTMSKLAALKLSRYEKNGKGFFWVLNVPGYLLPDGKRKKMLFRIKADAERKRAEFVEAAKTDSKEHILTNSQIVDARRALERLSEAGLTCSLDKAIELAMPLLKASGEYTTVQTLIAEFAEIKAPEWREKTARNFRDIAKKFVAAFGSYALTAITPKMLREWLVSSGSPSYAAGLIRTIRPAFNYAYRQGLIPFSPFEKMERIKVPKRQGVDIFTPREAALLMAAAPNDSKAAFALLLFAGVRPVELTRLKWSDIREGYIHITPSVAKTEQVRNIEIEDNLQEWLNKFQPLTDDAFICPPNWKRKSQSARRVAGLAGRQDTARHSYATYHLAKYQNKAALEANLGHTTGSAMLMRHYRAAATPADAAEYWSIFPAK